MLREWIDIFCIFICGVALFLSIMALWFTAVIPGIDRWSRRFFIDYFAVLLLCCLSGLAEMAFQYFHVPRGAMYFILLLESLLLSLPLPMLTVYLLHCCEENIPAGRLLHAVLGLWAIGAVLLAVGAFNDAFVYVAADNYYYRGPLYPLMLLPMVAVTLLNLIGALRRKKRLARKVFLSFLIATVPMAVALLVQMFTDFFPLLDIAYVGSALAMYGLVLSSQIEQSLRQQRENARLQTEIMLSQIQPHFLNNTIVAIGQLCGGAPEAKSALYKFAAYLQGNMDSLFKTDPIPFATELEHTKAFLELERLRFGEKLTVVYDLEATEFLLPTLTLQPIVENAVEHGVRENGDGAGTVTVSSREYPDRWEITVCDDGPGFDPGEIKEDGKRRIGLQNVRKRLRQVCGGGLRIDSAPGKGCRVTIELPKETGGNDADIRH